MTLHTDEFRLHRSLKKVIRRFREEPDSEIKVDSNFSAVLDACSNTYRHGQSGTWILPEMKTAYLELHQKGYAHSVETWKDGKLDRWSLLRIGGARCFWRIHVCQSEHGCIQNSARSFGRNDLSLKVSEVD